LNLSAKLIFDSAPLGALIRFSDGLPRPQARFTKKLAAWEQCTGVGRLIRKTPPSTRNGYCTQGDITLHEGNFASRGVFVPVVHRTHGFDSPLCFEVPETPQPDLWRVVRSFGHAIELHHLADDRAAAESWLRANRRAGARIEPIEAETNAALPQTATAASSTHSTPEAL
jgi:hypothetical protein